MPSDHNASASPDHAPRLHIAIFNIIAALLALAPLTLGAIGLSNSASTRRLVGPPTVDLSSMTLIIGLSLIVYGVVVMVTCLTAATAALVTRSHGTIPLLRTTTHIHVALLILTTALTALAIGYTLTRRHEMGDYDYTSATTTDDVREYVSWFYGCDVSACGDVIRDWWMRLTIETGVLGCVLSAALLCVVVSGSLARTRSMSPRSDDKEFGAKDKIEKSEKEEEDYHVKRITKDDINKLGARFPEYYHPSEAAADAFTSNSR